MDSAYSATVDEVISKLGTDEKNGLTEEEASRRLSTHGRNEIPPPPPTPFLVLVFKQFEDLLVLILLGAAVVSFILALFEDSDHRLTAFMEPAVILVILICNATVGVLQETNAEKAIEKLKEMEALEARVIRGGIEKNIDPALLVPGDLVIISNGDKVPADVRLIRLNGKSIALDESSLTGEPIAVNKTTAAITGLKNAVDQDKKNILFRSTLVTSGGGVAIVVLTGAHTSIGKIQGGIQDVEEQKTPLQTKLDEFGEFLSKVIGAICILVWLINIGHFFDPEHGGVVQGAIYYFKIAVALAVAAIPEGLPAVVTTCLALGTMKMARKNAIVRSLPSVETLGCTTVICSDKTGTLTTNKMSVRKMLTVESLGSLHEWAVGGDGSWSPYGKISLVGGTEVDFPPQFEALQKISLISCLCNDASLEVKRKDGIVEYSKIGESTEAALKVLAEKIGVPNRAEFESSLKEDDPDRRAHLVHNFWNNWYSREFTLEFEESRMSMGVVAKSKKGGKRVLLVKGAPEQILRRCSSLILTDGTKKDEFTPDLKESILKKFESSFSAEGLRCLAFAYVEDPKYSDEDYVNSEKFLTIESKMTFVGIAGMLDPPREQVKGAIRVCKQAGIRVVMITGDNPTTATAIAKMIGLVDPKEDAKGKVFTGSQLIDMSEKEQLEAAKNAVVFARVQPLHKQKLVEVLQKEGEVVAMTGDGVNDAPALKKADIGVAMGSGTAVAKEASSMVLQDDNFSTIVMAVEQGRAIYTNTKQFIRYLISSNIGEVVCIFTTAAVGMPEALIPVQLLWVNLVTDGLPATALGFNPPDPDIMKHAPRGRDEPIISGWLFFRYMVIGTYVGLATVFGFIWWFLYFESGPQLSWTQLTNFHSCGSDNALFTGVDCALFDDPRPSTVSLSVLVVIEMFNTFNALSENQSLLTVPFWANPWVLGAVTLSTLLHFMILYVPFFSNVFLVAPIGSAEWIAVVAISFPVIIIDEILKFVSRNLTPSGKTS